MNSNVTRSFASLWVATVTAGASAAAAPEGVYGFAPESLDLAASSRENSALLLDRARMEELATITDEDPFGEAPIRPIDPLSKRKVARVLVGPVFRARAYGTSFDYYRYVTFYDIRLRKERIYALPVLHEDCHDQSEVFGSYSYTKSYSASMSASVGIEGLGLSTSITDTRTFSTSRNLRATGNLIADHIPYFSKQDWVGRTFMQTFTKKTGKAAFIVRESAGSPLWIKTFFPILASERYPYPFEIKDADWTFSVEREILGNCSSAPAATDEHSSHSVTQTREKTAEKAREVPEPEPAHAHAHPSGGGHSSGS